VDVFFVISGFLIGGLLWGEMIRTGRISLANFYLRRFRRLAPAFFVMALVVSVAAWIWMLPFELREFGKSLVAATVYLSNVQFFREAGYFDIGADEKLLLHTWSLAVEEQFYVFLPVFMLALSRIPKLLVPVLGIIAAVSLLACILLTPISQTATFFLFPFRAWELLAGVLLAIWGHQRSSDWALHPALSWLGLVLILWGIAMTQAGAGFPGWQAMVPVLGTLMVLANGQDRNAVNRVLRSAPMVFVGLISYSLYLWHWPVAVLSKYVRETYSGALETAGWIGLSVVLAILSWRFVERPTRHAHHLGFRAVLGAVAAISIVTVGIGFALFKFDGFPSRYPPHIRTHIDASGDFLQDWSRCTVAQSGPLAGVETCAIGPDGPPQVVFWGDSHLRALMDGIAAVATETKVPGMIIWHAGCPPFFGVTKRESAATPAQDQDCHADNAAIRVALPDIGMRDVVLVGRWAYYATGTGIGRDVQNTITLLPEDAQQTDRFARLLEQTVTEVSRYARVHVLQQVPEVPEYDSRLTARRLAHGRDGSVAASFSVPVWSVDERQASSTPILQDLAEQGLIDLINPQTVLCEDGTCSVLHNDQVLYFDNNHLTNRGAYALAPVFVPLLTGEAQND